MNDKQLDRSLRSIGKECFVKYFKQFSDMRIKDLKFPGSDNRPGARRLRPRVFAGVCADMGKPHQNTPYPRRHPPRNPETPVKDYQLIDILMKNEGYTEIGCKTRVSQSRRIIREGRVIDALKEIIASERLSERVRQEAADLVKSI